MMTRDKVLALLREALAACERRDPMMARRALIQALKTLEAEPVAPALDEEALAKLAAETWRRTNGCLRHHIERDMRAVVRAVLAALPRE